MPDPHRVPKAEPASVPGAPRLPDSTDMGDAQDWTWAFRTARPAVELFAIATVLLSAANALPGLIVAVAALEYRDEAPRAAAASPELLADELQSITMVGAFGVALALMIAVVGYRLVRRWTRGSSDIDAPRAVPAAAVISSAAVVAASFVATSEPSLAGAFFVGATLLVVTSFATVGASQVRAALRTTPR